jgi:hypothetical protein
VKISRFVLVLVFIGTALLLSLPTINIVQAQEQNPVEVYGMRSLIFPKGKAYSEVTVANTSQQPITDPITVIIKWRTQAGVKQKYKQQVSGDWLHLVQFRTPKFPKNIKAILRDSNGNLLLKKNLKHYGETADACLFTESESHEAPVTDSSPANLNHTVWFRHCAGDIAITDSAGNLLHPPLIQGRYFIIIGGVPGVTFHTTQIAEVQVHLVWQNQYILTHVLPVAPRPQSENYALCAPIRVTPTGIDFQVFSSGVRVALREADIHHTEHFVNTYGPGVYSYPTNVSTSEFLILDCATDYAFRNPNATQSSNWLALPPSN